MTRASKVLPPSVPPSFVSRPRLEKQLDDVSAHRLTTIVAGPGFGKSTLLAAWAPGVKAAWYTLGNEDADLSSLAPGLVRALQLRVLALSPSIAKAIMKGPREDKAQASNQAEAFAAQLMESLEEHAADPIHLVLDDVQEIAGGTAASRLLEALVRHATPGFHVVLSSRLDPPFAVERLRGHGEVLSIDAPALAFTPHELTELLELSLGAVDHEFSDHLHEMTGGWPTAVRLAIESLRAAEPGERDRVLQDLSRRGVLFRYLAEEVFARESPAVRRLLQRIAQFDHFTDELCEAVGIRGAREALSSLLTRGLFIQTPSGSKGWLTMHALVRDFARERWPLKPREAKEVLGLAARWFESNHLLEDALQSFATAGDWPSAARMLAKSGADLCAAGRTETVIRVADLLPPTLRDTRIEEIAGEAQSIRGEAPQALECFRRAAGDQDTLPPGLAWKMGTIHYYRGQLEEALRVFRLGRIDAGQTADEALLLASEANTHRLLGHAETARSKATRALEMAMACGSPPALAAAHNAVGNVAELAGDGPAAETHYRSAIESAERAGDISQVARQRVNLSSQLYVAGRYQEALDEVETALPLAELAGYELIRGFGLAFRGAAQFALGRLEESIADHQTGAALLKRVGANNWASIPLGGLGDAYRQRGDLALARAAYQEAVALADESRDIQALVPALAGLARTVVGDEPEEAGRLAERAVAPGSGWGHVSALLASGWVALARRERQVAASLAIDAAAAAARSRDRAGLAESGELHVMSSEDPSQQRGRLEEVIGIWSELGNPLGRNRAELALARLSMGLEARVAAERAERKLRELGVRISAASGAAGLLAAIPGAEDTPLEIRSLGGFRVLREGQPVPLVEWQSKKARTLLKILVARRGRPTPRDFLMETLWPEEDPRRLANRLSVALATVRAVLDPDRAHPQDHLLMADQDAIGLNVQDVAIDVEAFMAEAHAGLQRQREVRGLRGLGDECAGGGPGFVHLGGERSRQGGDGNR